MPSRLTQWLESHCPVDRTSDMPGLYRNENSPWLDGVFSAVDATSTREVIASCAAQSSKTLFGISAAAYLIAEKPGPMLVVQDSDHNAEKFSRQRFIPFLENCPPVSELFPESRHEKGLLEINFPHMPLNITGANSLGKLQSKPCSRLILDEVRNWKSAGALPIVLKRVRKFYGHKILMLSCPGKKGDLLDEHFTSGTQKHFHVACPNCSGRFPLRFSDPLQKAAQYEIAMPEKFGGMKWDDNETTRPNHVWNIPEVMRTIRYICPHCFAPILDVAPVRQRLAMSGQWVTHNPNPSPGVESFTWSALLPTWVNWADIVVEFLHAKEQAKLGFMEPLQDWVNETCGETWEDRKDRPRFEPIKSDYNPKDKWDLEQQRFLTADYQTGGSAVGSHLWFVVMAWSSDGAARVLSEGKIDSLEELEAKRVEWGVTPKRTLVDCAAEPGTVLPACARYGWWALRGSKFPSFSIKLKNGKTVKRVWRRVVSDPYRGTQHQGKHKVMIFEFSADSVMDILSALMSTKDKWFLPQNISEDFVAHIKAARREEIHDARGNARWQWTYGKNDHLLDCCKENATAAIMAGLLKIGDAPEAEAAQETEPLPQAA